MTWKADSAHQKEERIGRFIRRRQRNQDGRNVWFPIKSSSGRGDLCMKGTLAPVGSAKRVIPGIQAHIMGAPCHHIHAPELTSHIHGN